MANTLRIKRSASTNTPASLLQGEMAFSEAGSPNGIGELFIGTTGPNVTKLLSMTGGNPAEPNQIITTGTGLDGADAGSSGAITISLDVSELAEKTGAVVGTDRLTGTTSGGVNFSETISGIPLSIFTNDAGFLTAEADTLSTVAARGSSTGTACTFSGGLNMADTDLNRPVLEDYGVKHQVATVSANAVTVNFTLGNSVLIDLDPGTAAVALTLSNPPAAGTYGEVLLSIVQGTPAVGITWPGSVVWPGATAPDLTATTNAVDRVHLYTIDGGTTYYGSYALADVAPGAGGGISSIATGTGLTGGTITTSGTIDLELNAVAEKTGSLVAGDRLVGVSGTTHFAETISAIPLSIFSNDGGWQANDANTVLTTSVGSASWNWILDEDAMGSNSAAHVPTQQSVKAYVDNAVSSALIYKGGYNASTNTPALDTGSPTLSIGDTYTVTVAGTFFTVALEVGDMLIAEVDSVDAASVADWTIVQNNIGAASETAAGYIEIATQAETDAASDDARAITALKLHATTFDGGSF